MGKSERTPETVRRVRGSGLTWRHAWRHAAYFVVVMLAASVVLGGVLAVPAKAVTIQGGTEAQRTHIRQVIEACLLPCQSTDSELRAMGPVKVVVTEMDGVSGYSKLGVIFINSVLQPGDKLGELVAHEWAHQIWYSLGPKWWEKWAELCGGSPSEGVAWSKDPAENFAECAKIALWESKWVWRDYAVTDLEVIGPEVLREWVTLARYVNKCPFTDLGPNAMPTTSVQDELAAAAAYVSTEGIMQGVSAGTFQPDARLTKKQLCEMCARAGVSCPAAWRFDYATASRGDVRDGLAGLSWNQQNWSAPITRGQVARLLWRAR